MIWSIMPEEFIFAANTEQQQLLSCSYLGRQVLVKPTGNGQGQITALLSTNPADFLDNRFAAGNIINVIN